MSGKALGFMALFCVAVLTAPDAAWAGGMSLDLGGIRVHKRIRSLKEIRQAYTVRQRWDRSCGSAALSTLLTFQYGDKVSEIAVITSILSVTDSEKVRARGGFSLLDLKKFVEARGYVGKGYAGLTLEELMGLGGPAIVPVSMKGYDHFAVFRGIRGGHANLSDPAFGTITMKKERFLEIWKEGIGFIVLPGNGLSPYNGLAPKEEEFFVPDSKAITRSLLRTGIAPVTRNGF